MSADEEDHYTIAQANARSMNGVSFRRPRFFRRNQQFRFTSVQRVDYMDVAPRPNCRCVGRVDSFLEHDDANRADGFQHAATGRALAAAGRAHRQHGHGTAGRVEFRSGVLADQLGAR